MQVRRGLEMLAVMAMVLLASSVTDGVVLNKFELEKQLTKAQLNSTEVAKIVCHVQQTSCFNTSMVNHLNVTEDEGKHPGGRKHPVSNHPSHHSTSKQDNVTYQAEHLAGKNETQSQGRRSRGVKSARINPAKHPNSNPPPHSNSREDKTDDQEDVHHASGVHPTTQTPQTSKSRPKVTPGLNSSHPQDGSNNSTRNNSTRNNSISNNSTSNISTSNNSSNYNFRKSRSLRSEPQSKPAHPPEFDDKSFNVALHDFNDFTVNKTAHLETHCYFHRQKRPSNPQEHGRQWIGFVDPAHAGSSKESEEHEDDDGTWTFYGLFQLADRVACVSGNKTSLNLCGMSCDDLTDDIITDDIACVRTIINSTLSMEDGSTPFNELIKQMYDVLHDCDTKMGSQNLAGC